MTVKLIDNKNGKERMFDNVDEATDFVKRQKKGKGAYTMIEIKEAKSEDKKSKSAWKDEIDFNDAVVINRGNVKHYYGRPGYIKVVDPDGNTKHIGKTINMGKVFSNYVNCARYNQSYDYNEEGGDVLYYKEADISK